jgi:hypothetical protein
MFNIKRVIGWIGNMAVVPTEGGVFLVEWATGKRIFVPKDTEGEG